MRMKLRHLPKSVKGELREAERDEEREFAPQAIPSVFCAVFFFLLESLPSLLEEAGFDEIDLKLRFDFEPDLELITVSNIAN